MYNIGKQSQEQKRKQEKMNMFLNNLEQKLGGNTELCQGIAKVIDMTIENNELVSRLEEIESNIPEIEQRISNLISNCVTSCSQARTDVMLAIHDMLSESGERPRITEYMLKIQKTIDYCIADYPTYKKSGYNAKYCVGGDFTKNTSSMTTEELLMLI
jgi:hypothetical protein